MGTTELLVRDAISLRAAEMQQESTHEKLTVSDRMSRMTRRYPASDQPSCVTVPATTPEARRRYLNTEEAAEIVRLSPRTLERLRKEGSGPRYLKPGKGVRARVLYRATDLEAWLEQAVFSSTAEYGARR